MENIQTPDNLGAVARTAEALGLDGLIVSGGCDIYNPKALRACMGAFFRLNIIECDDVIGFTMFNNKSDKKSLYDGTYQQVNSLNTLVMNQATSVYIDKVVIDGVNNGGAQSSSTLVISENGSKITLNLDFNVIGEGVKTRTYVCNGVN